MNFRLIAGFALAALAGSAFAKDTPAPASSRPAPHFNVDRTPIDRDATLRVSFAPVVRQAAQSVVYISSTKRVKRQDMSQLFQDPLFRRFFGNPNGPGDGNGGGGGGGGNGGGSRTERQESLGSGIIVSANGYILTNNHVVDGADDVKVHVGESHTEYKAKVVARDSAVDVAVLKIEATGLTAAVLGDSDQLQVGDTVLAVGNPFDVGMTVTHGIVSALGRNKLGIEDFEDFIQTDAPINPGNSGGALLDTKGRVVGINTAILTHTGGSNGIGFAIPINLVRSIADQLIEHGKVSRGMLGVSLQEITPDLAEQFGITNGALITDVKAGMPAEKAGLKSGDVITKLNGKPVQDRQQLSLAISELPPGTVVQLEYVRGTQTLHATLTLGDRASFNLNGDNAGGESNGTDNGVLNGVAVQDLTAEVREELHPPVGLQGAVVTEVDPNSASAQVGLQKGDIILELKGTGMPKAVPVHNSQEAIKLSAEIKGPKVLVRIWRSVNGVGVYQFVVVDESQAPSADKNSAPSSEGNSDGDENK